MANIICRRPPFDETLDGRDPRPPSLHRHRTGADFRETQRRRAGNQCRDFPPPDHPSGRDLERRGWRADNSAALPSGKKAGASNAARRRFRQPRKRGPWRGGGGGDRSRRWRGRAVRRRRPASYGDVHRSPDRAEAVIVPGRSACRNQEPAMPDNFPFAQPNGRASFRAPKENAEISKDFADAEETRSGRARGRAAEEIRKRPEVAAANALPMSGAGASRRRPPSAIVPLANRVLGCRRLRPLTERRASTSVAQQTAERYRNMPAAPPFRRDWGRSRPPGAACCRGPQGDDSFGYPAFLRSRAN